MLQPTPPPPIFKTTQNIVEKYSQTLCWLIEPRIPSSICLFSLYDFQCCYSINWYWVVNRSTSQNTHCVKSVGIRSFFWSVFSCILTEYGEMGTISKYSVEMQENVDKTNSEYWHFSRGDTKHNNHKTARVNGSFEALLRRFSWIIFIFILRWQQLQIDLWFSIKRFSSK